ncbi:hypothetical protein JCGZ_20102 [Jatropha curcas]|uniref:C2H2-type domain-containing protein n=1 Tax=Jatropha curcas TaxID=180498 RepID=A0A067JUG6_JATCU|nr:hypothetical protein JCGZ_20102 [Jatropha curcas]
MATELALLSLNHLHHRKQPQQNQHQPNPTAWMWNPNKQTPEDDDSWEVKAFEEDTGNVMGTTWPPRSYTCTFCRREFRSAQALGGHMNVHRRDRARLHRQTVLQPTPPLPPGTISSSNSSTFLIPTQEFSTNGGGLCLLYQLPNPNGVFTPTNISKASPIDPSPSTVLSISPYPQIGQSLTNNYQVINSSHYHSGRPEAAASAAAINKNNSCKELAKEEVDLELRLGHRSTTSPSST